MKNLKSKLIRKKKVLKILLNSIKKKRMI